MAALSNAINSNSKLSIFCVPFCWISEYNYITTGGCIQWGKCTKTGFTFCEYELLDAFSFWFCRDGRAEALALCTYCSSFCLKYNTPTIDFLSERVNNQKRNCYT
nr:MAG TPA: hypothetical protein [Ackermannviridae sp.]